jgi:hypothetical protein
MDIAKYEINKEFVKRKYDERKTNDLIQLIAELAVGTMCPCIAIAYWVGEASNWPPEVVEHIKMLKDFYGYGEIYGKPPGSPI